MATPEGMLTVKEVAAKAGIDPKALRRLLRKDFGGGEKKRYIWKKGDPIIAKIVTAAKAAVKAAQEPKPAKPAKEAKPVKDAKAPEVKKKTKATKKVAKKAKVAKKTAKKADKVAAPPTPAPATEDQTEETGLGDELTTE